MNQLVAEINAYERVGLPNALELFGVGGTKWANMSDFQKKIAKITQSPRERFMLSVDAIARNLGERKIIDEPCMGDLEAMFTKVDSLKNIEHTNPYGYVLGYSVTKGGRVMDKALITKMFGKLPTIGDGGIEKADLVRYANLWVRLSK